MTRKLIWIVNGGARRASLRKRRVGLVKKVGELATLCGVSCFVAIYSPNEGTPMVCPPNLLEARQVLRRFLALPEADRKKLTVTQETFLMESATKMRKKMVKARKMNREKEMSSLMFQLYYGKGIGGFDLVERHVLTSMVEERLAELRKRIEALRQFHNFVPLPPQNSNFEERTNIGGGEDGANPSNAIANN